MLLQPNQLSGNFFIDENHQGLLLLITDLAEEVQLRTLEEGNTWQDIQANANDYVQSLEQHFHHEEVILKGANYSDLGEHAAKHREISFFLRTIANKDFTKEIALFFVESARTKIFSHELIEDQDYWPVFEEEDRNPPPLISWSKKIETGDSEVDAHHRALINFLNRLYLRVSSDMDQNLLSEELESLYAYTDFHFAEEQKLFEPLLSAKDKVLHETDHQHLLSDLRIVINETKSGTYSVEGLGDYLKYWFLNHLLKFDKPAFKSSRSENDL